DHLIHCDRGFGGVNDGFEFGFQGHVASSTSRKTELPGHYISTKPVIPFHGPILHLQSSLTASWFFITSSKWECLRMRISPKSFSCRSWIACRRTSSNRARNIHTSACRDCTLESICLSRIGRSSKLSRRRK